MILTMIIKSCVCVYIYIYIIIIKYRLLCCVCSVLSDRTEDRSRLRLGLHAFLIAVSMLCIIVIFMDYVH